MGKTLIGFLLCGTLLFPGSLRGRGQAPRGGGNGTYSFSLSEKADTVESIAFGQANLRQAEWSRMLSKAKRTRTWGLVLTPIGFGLAFAGLASLLSQRTASDSNSILDVPAEGIVGAVEDIGSIVLTVLGGAMTTLGVVLTLSGIKRVSVLEDEGYQNQWIVKIAFRPHARLLDGKTRLDGWVGALLISF